MNNKLSKKWWSYFCFMVAGIWFILWLIKVFIESSFANNGFFAQHCDDIIKYSGYISFFFMLFSGLAFRLSYKIDEIRKEKHGKIDIYENDYDISYVSMEEFNKLKKQVDDLLGGKYEIMVEKDTGKVTIQDNIHRTKIQETKTTKSKVTERNIHRC